MKRTILPVVVYLLWTPFLDADDLASIPNDEARKWGARLAKLADDVENPQIKIVADADKANGVHVPDKLGVVVVPQKNLQEGEELAAKFKTGSGASLAYLFAYNLVPVVDGKRVDANRLRTVTLTDEQGEEHRLFLILLAVRQLAEDDYRLYGFGKDKRPIVDARFSGGANSGPGPVTVEITDPNEQTREGNLSITVFGRFRASFRVGYTEE